MRSAGQRALVTLAGLVILTALGAIVALASDVEVAARASQRFVKRSANFDEAKLFDLGVADIDRDGILDVFTTNHKFLSTFKLGNGKGFGRNLNGYGLEQSYGLPYLENLFERPDRSKPGFYFWIDERGRVHLQTRALGAVDGLSTPVVTGKLSFYGPYVGIETKRSAEATERRLGTDINGIPRVEVNFRIGRFGHAVIDPPHVDLPIAVTIDDPYPLGRTFVGTRRAHPSARQFAVTLRDRHGIAWADLSGDGRVDAYIARGGLGGRIPRYEGIVEDELLVQGRSGYFLDQADQLDVVKGVCRSREANAIDYNRDGRLDLYSACKASNPQLYLQTTNGRFVDDSTSLAGAASRGVCFEWFDLNGDTRPELLAARRGQVSVFSRDRLGDWDRTQLIRTYNDANQVAAILPAAIDRGSSPDFFVAARSGNSILINHGGKLHARRPSAYGLPGSEGSVAASWVDYNNDGLLDLHLIPQGIYRRSSPGHFAATGLLRGGSKALWAIDHWADFDNDGDRDYLAAIKGGGRAVRVIRYENKLDRGHWLELDLTGSQYNQPAVGARVIVKSGGHRQVQRVGEAEGSRFSQGHYRVYFGLGHGRKAKRVDQVTVVWPNQSRTRFRDFSADQKLDLTIPPT